MLEANHQDYQSLEWEIFRPIELVHPTMYILSLVAVLCTIDREVIYLPTFGNRLILPRLTQGFKPSMSPEYPTWAETMVYSANHSGLASGQRTTESVFVFCDEKDGEIPK